MERKNITAQKVTHEGGKVEYKLIEKYAEDEDTRALLKLVKQFNFKPIYFNVEINFDDFWDGENIETGWNPEKIPLDYISSIDSDILKEGHVYLMSSGYKEVEVILPEADESKAFDAVCEVMKKIGKAFEGTEIEVERFYDNNGSRGFLKNSVYYKIRFLVP